MRIATYCGATIALVLLFGCASTDTYVAQTSGIDKQTKFLIQRTDSDSLDLANVFASELRLRGYSSKLSYGSAAEKSQQARPKPAEVSRSTGSGFFVSSNGIALTNAHVINGADRISVLLRNGLNLPAELVAVDHINDVCVLAVNGLTEPVQTLSIGTSGKIALGEPIHVIGYPLSSIVGVAPRVTEGSVSSNTGFGDSPTHFQISAPVQPGSSGGPVLNESLSVIGIATSKLSDSAIIEATGSIPQNVNFALKIDYARLLLRGDLIPHSSIPRSLDEAANATILVVAEKGQRRNEGISTTQPPAKLDESSNVIIIRFRYQANYDVIHWQLRSLTIDFADPASGEVLLSGRFSGDTPSSAKTTAKKVIRRMLDDAGL